MKRTLATDKLRGVWSATPTPLNHDKTIDIVSVKRLVDHHLRLGINGLFLGGTCGEGPFMPNTQRRVLVRAAARYARGRLLLAVQVTDNSAERILENTFEAKEDGADIAVIAPPFFFVHPRTDAILKLYREAIRRSELPVGLYDFGHNRGLFIPDDVMAAAAREPNVCVVKDSSTDPRRREIFLAARRARPSLRLFTGAEFQHADYIKAGYDGGLLGGGIFNGYLARLILEAVKAGDTGKADRLQRRMNRLMYDVYGGKKITCWLAGLKHLLVEMGIFRTRASYLDYPLTPSCRKAIARALKQDRDVLLP